MKKYAIGVDVGGSHVCSSVIEITSGKICTDPVTTPIDSKGAASGIIDGWASNILETASLLGEPVSDVGMALPGPFDYDRGISMIHGVDKFEGIYGLNVGDALKSVIQPKIGPVEFRFVNDASAFALGECLGGAARDTDKVVAITLGTGVGSGFVDSKRLVVSGDRVPANGWVYCIPFEGDIADAAFSTRWFVRRYKELTGMDISGAKDVVDMYDSDAAARHLLDEYGRRFADFVSPLARRFGAGKLVLGGNISRAYPLFRKSLEEGLAKNCCDVTVCVSELMDRAAMMGAASLFL